MKRILFIVIILSMFSLGALSPSEKEAFIDRYGYWEYSHSIEYFDYEIGIATNPPGAIIEIDGECVGWAGLVFIADGTWWKNKNMIIKAIPSEKGQYVQTKVLDGSKPFPCKVYFDMYLNNGVKEQ